MHNPFRRPLLGLVLALSFVAAPSTVEARPLVIATMPVETSEIQAGVFGLLAKDLEKRVGQAVRFVRPPSYGDVIILISEGKIDVALIGAVGYVKARHKNRARVVLTAVRGGKSSYRGQIVVPATSKVTELAQLRGKKVVFVDPNSTAGYLYPRRLLEKAGLNIDKDLKIDFAGGHHKVVDIVYRRAADAGACFEGAENLVEQPEQLRVLGYTEAVPGDAVVVRAGLTPELVEKITKAFEEMHEIPEGEDFLLLSGIDRFVPAKDADYDKVEEFLKLR